MLRILSILFVCALGASTVTGCPPNLDTRMMACVQPIQGIQSSGQNLRQMCRTMNRALDCVQDLMNSCPNSPAIAQMASMLNMDHVRSLVNSRCSGGPAPTYRPGSNDNCPSRFQQKILKCVEPMQNMGGVDAQNVVQACGIAVAGIDCLDNILNKCAGEPQVQAMTSMLNIDSMRSLIQTHCSSIGAGNNNNNNNNNDNCPPGYRQRLMDCIGPLETIDTLEDDVACSVATDGVGCLEMIMTTCGNKPEVQALSGVVDIDQMRASAQLMCSGGGDVPGTGAPANTCSVPDPGAELQRCNGFLSSFQRGGGPSSAGCRTLYRGFDCFRSLINTCPNDPTVLAFTSMIDIEDARQSMSVHCPV